jgi:hypothetical protein
LQSADRSQHWLAEDLKLTDFRTQSAKQRGEQRSQRGNRPITKKEADDVEEMSSPRTPVIYEVVRRLGDEEMDRPIFSLWWSGVAAGLSISFSLLAEAVLQSHLPRRHGRRSSAAWAIRWGS